MMKLVVLCSLLFVLFSSSLVVGEDEKKGFLENFVRMTLKNLDNNEEISKEHLHAYLHALSCDGGECGCSEGEGSEVYDYVVDALWNELIIEREREIKDKLGEEVWATGMRAIPNALASSTYQVMWTTSHNIYQPDTIYVLVNEETKYPGNSYTYDTPHVWYDKNGTTSWQNYALVPINETITMRGCGVSATDDTVICHPSLDLPPFTFTPLSVSQEEDGSSQIAVWGDHGTFQGIGWEVTKRMHKDFDSMGYPTAAIVAGDIAYAGIDITFKPLGLTSQSEWMVLWDKYAELNECVTSKIPVFYALGNHDNFNNATAIRHRYPGPQQQSTPGATPPFWYSYDINRVHVVSMSSEHSYNPGSPQYQWVQAELQSSFQRKKRNEIDWIFMTFHRPIYCSDEAEYSSHSPGGALQTYIEPLMLEYGVDLSITGHMHMYERTHPVINGTVEALPRPIPSLPPNEYGYLNPKAPLHFVVGSSGAVQDERLVDPQPHWSSHRRDNTIWSYGYGVFDVYNSSHLRWHFRALKGGEMAEDVIWIVNE